MLELSAANAAEYVVSRGLPPPLRVRELGGGVSNTVLLVEGCHARFVLKQALGKLRVEQDWFSERTRIFREASALRRLANDLPPGSVPDVLFEDRENCLFAMLAAPEGAPNWKSQLLEGAIREEIAGTVGRLLGLMFRASWMDSGCEREFGDQTVFDQLRLDPYYRSTAARHPDLKRYFDRLLERTAARRYSLVHGDWSPKNFLIFGDQVTAIDFEVIHYGDPAFDAGFLLNHLLLKSFYRPQWRERYARLAAVFWSALRETMPAADWFEAAALEHLGCLLLARIDGKSPAEYIQDPGLKGRIRAFARELIVAPPAGVEEVFR